MPGSVSSDPVVKEKTSQSSVQESRIEDADVSGVNMKALMRKIDIRLMPWLCLLYLLSFLDRSSIGNAKLYGLLPELKMSDNEYLIALSLFFIPYALGEVPSNILLKRLRPSIWLSILMIVWSIAMTAQGLIHNYAGLLSMRIVLGLAEAGLFPGVTYLLSCWYKRAEFGLRLAIFFSCATLSGAFGGLLAFALAKMDGIGKHSGWAWIFIIEGIATFIAAVLSFWLVHDFPDNATFLNEYERAAVIGRLQDDAQWSAAGEKLKLRNVWQAFKDWKTWVGMVIYAGLDGPLYAFSLFVPSIVAELGFSANRANLLTIPVYVWACFCTIAVGFFADKFNKRGVFNLLCFGMGLIGAAILIASRNASLSYFAVYVMAGGIYPLIPNTAVWVANNVEGTYKRGVVIGMVVGFGNLNGVVSGQIYRAKDAPWYRTGHSAMFAYFAIGFIFTLIMMYGLRRENARRDRGERDEKILGSAEELTAHGRGGTFTSIDEARTEKGDLWSGFRYVI
ncbi:MFS general substrate transporter [Exidia glandulosa HHB12029]|uniref:MFS general substrate transporter n=1 Tax=Exidia glandulosa HHB12029 TaxID=1314781 RepID=A0A165JB97_EXIGL|nr:MFS general substrate transporter [Exidia glandulosa HHB12029]